MKADEIQVDGVTLSVQSTYVEDPGHLDWPQVVASSSALGA